MIRPCFVCGAGFPEAASGGQIACATGHVYEARDSIARGLEVYIDGVLHPEATEHLRETSRQMIADYIAAGRQMIADYIAEHPRH